MTKLQWDVLSERFYEAGLDRGVLYLPSSPGNYDNGVPWNGLISVEEDLGDDTTNPLYFDGVKYLDQYTFGDALFVLSAYTYPDEFITFEGVDELGEGTYLDDQQAKVFSLSFRTLLKSEAGSKDYKIHILYNLTAVVNSTNYATLTGETSPPMIFEWSLAGKPESAVGFRPTAYVLIDTRFLSPELLTILEEILYGVNERTLNAGRIDGLYPTSPQTDILDGGTPMSPGPELVDGNTYTVPAADPYLPSLETLIKIVNNLRPQRIEPHVSGIADLLPGEGDLSPTDNFGLFWALPTTRLVPSAIPGLYDLIGGAEEDEE